MQQGWKLMDLTMTPKSMAQASLRRRMTLRYVCRRAIDDVCTWMQSNRLQLNTNKTEVLWCATARRQHQLPRSTFRVGTDAITPSTTVRDLGIFIDSDLSMQYHVQRTVAGCFAVLRQLRSIRRSVPTSVFQTLVVALVLTKMDYGNATLADLPATLLSCHTLLLGQSPIFAARLTSRTPLPVFTGCVPLSE